jgi:GT2 family glycosyltransferase
VNSEDPGHAPNAPPAADGPAAQNGLDVVIVAYGAPDLLDACLDSLHGAFPVTVVDNSSSDDVHQVATAHGATYVDPGSNLGFAGGVNVGVRHLARPHGDVLLLNPDAEVSADAVTRLHARLLADPGLACVAPAQVDPRDGSGARVGWPFPTPGGAWVEAVGLGGLRRRVDFLIGSVLLVRTEALEDVGPFDEDFFLYAEEIDWQRRATSRGWRTALCPEITATHVGSGTGGDPAEREIHFQASHERYIRKHFGTLGWWVYRSAMLAGSTVRALVLPGGRRRQAAFRVRLYWAGPLRFESRLPRGANAG